ncbi:tRNA wybutosine-synthesizing protein 4-like isoform X2 [Montipora capricornis]|uniref:tRNA wybutosine-synthesizing protein 4-like isoform X2 n=1 Tax=Montipora capricornis TaxID=246305 RepID=UPI0035F129B9
METFRDKTDTQVQGTNDHATLSKLSTVRMGYYEDSCLKYFVSKTSRRAPIIHRSYYIRTKAIQFVVKGFLQSLKFRGLKKQIVSLGAGYDTLFFSLTNEGLLKETKYFEVDFPEVVEQKTSLILKNKELAQALGTLSSQNEPWLGGGINSENYSLVGCNLKSCSALESCLLKCGLNTSSATLVLSEVVLTYINPPKSSTDIIGWVACFFMSAIFVMFEQVHPNDPFGIKMMNHFQHTVGAPLHGTKAFPTQESQIQRFVEEGWTHVRCPTLNFIYYDTLSTEEKARMEGIEPFDEFEEWHLMCSHYIILTAFKGFCQSLEEELFCQQNVKEQLTDQSSHVDDKKCIIHTLNVLPSSDGVKRFGHTATPLSSGSVLLIGGFGLHERKHKRLDGMQLLHYVQDEWHCSEVTAASSSMLVGRMFHSATRLNNHAVLIYGGRTSPSKPCIDTVLLSPMATETSSPHVRSATCGYSSDIDFTCGEHFPRNYIAKESYKQTVLHCHGDIPEPRWRHTASCIVLSDGSENVLVFGGRSSTQFAMGDCYLLHIKSRTWRKIFLSGDTAVPRHSHTACVWNHKVILAGGLDANLHALNTIQILDTQVSPMTLRTLHIDPLLSPRYSHTAHVIDDKLVLVGGVTPNSSHPPGIVILHLESLAWNSFILPAFIAPHAPLMLHNHCSVCWNGSQDVVVLGGGGNCFSFGTHLNDGPVMIDLPLL